MKSKILVNKKNIISKKLLVLVSILTLSFGCSSSDDSNENDNPSGTYISASVNGNTFLAQPNQQGVLTIGATLVSTDILFSLTITGLDLNENLNGQGEAIAMALTGPNFDDINNGFEIFNSIQVDESFIDYIFVGGYDFTETGDEEQDFENVEGSNYFKITSIDKNAQVISGEFRFTVEELISGITYEVTQGVFNNIEYTLQE